MNKGKNATPFVPVADCFARDIGASGKLQGCSSSGVSHGVHYTGKLRKGEKIVNVSDYFDQFMACEGWVVALCSSWDQVIDLCRKM